MSYPATASYPASASYPAAAAYPASATYPGAWTPAQLGASVFLWFAAPYVTTSGSDITQANAQFGTSVNGLTKQGSFTVFPTLAQRGLVLDTSGDDLVTLSAAQTLAVDFTLYAAGTASGAQIIPFGSSSETTLFGFSGGSSIAAINGTSATGGNSLAPGLWFARYDFTAATGRLNVQYTGTPRTQILDAVTPGCTVDLIGGETPDGFFSDDTGNGILMSSIVQQNLYGTANDTSFCVGAGSWAALNLGISL